MHQKKYCKMINKDETTHIEVLSEEIKGLKEQIQGLTQQLSIVQPISNTTNNTNSNNQIQNIIINNYNSNAEIGDYSKNALESCMKLLMTFGTRTKNEQMNIINDVAKIMHIDDETNRNIYVSNLHDNFANILQNHKWIKVHKIEFFNEFINTKGKILYKLLEMTDVNDVTSGRIRAIINYIENDTSNEDNEKERICKELVLLFYNNKDLVTDSDKNSITMQTLEVVTNS